MQLDIWPTNIHTHTQRMSFNLNEPSIVSVCLWVWKWQMWMQQQFNKTNRFKHFTGHIFFCCTTTQLDSFIALSARSHTDNVLFYNFNTNFSTFEQKKFYDKLWYLFFCSPTPVSPIYCIKQPTFQSLCTFLQRKFYNLCFFVRFLTVTV